MWSLRIRSGMWLLAIGFWCAACGSMEATQAMLPPLSSTSLSAPSPVTVTRTSVVLQNTSTSTEAVEPLVGKIVFSSDRSGNWEIYVMNADGSGLSNVTNHPADDIEPSWAADGNRIIFASARDEESTVDPETGNIIPIFHEYVMNADGSDPERLPWIGSEPDWYRDDRIVYNRVVSNVQGTWICIAVNDPLDSGERILAWGGMSPKWSPDGQWIAFVGYPNGPHKPPGQLWIMRADGSEKKLLLEGTLGIQPVSWSPDGTEIAFAGDSDIIVVRVADGQARRVQAGPFRRCTSWSPDGKWLACECEQNICAVHIMTGKVIQLTPSVSSYHTDMFADWAQ